VAREDRRQLGVPHRPDRTTTPAPIRRAVENCPAAVRHRRSSSSTADQAPAVPYRINTSSSGGGGRNTPRPQPPEPLPGTEDVPRTIPNVIAHQEARDSRRLGRITTVPYT
jgi:hypothetical protein